MQFIQDFSVHVATLERFFKALSSGQIPAKADTEAAVVALVAFAFDEPDKDEAKRTILQELSLTEISASIKAILASAGPEIETLKAHAAISATNATNATSATSVIQSASAQDYGA